MCKKKNHEGFFKFKVNLVFLARAALEALPPTPHAIQLWALNQKDLIFVLSNT